MPPTSPSKLWAVPAAILVATVGVSAGWYFQLDRVFRPWDFAQYWAAGLANVRGQNPYDPALALQYQRAAPRAGRDDNAPVMMWNPPWTLAAYMPFGLTPPRTAWPLWLGLQLGAVLLSVRWLWRVYGGPPDWWWVPYAVALSSPAVVRLVEYGQNTGLILLGVAGFVYFTKRDRPVAAGVFVALTAIKPNLLAPFGLVLVLHGLTRAGRKALFAGGLAVAAALGLALATNPRVVDQYREALAMPAGNGFVPMSYWQLPTLPYELRKAIDPDMSDASFRIQFIPCAVACVAAAGYWFARRRRWDWADETPRLVWLSVLTVPYGGWIFDLTILLVPTVQAAAWVARSGSLVTATALASAGAVVALYSFRMRYLHDFIWVAPALFAAYLIACRATR